MSELSMTIAVIVYGIVTVALIAYFVHEANDYERKWRRTQGRLAAAYRHSAQLEQMLEDKAHTIYELNRKFAELKGRTP